jgi:hypothetical protein
LGTRRQPEFLQIDFDDAPNNVITVLQAFE